MVKTNFPNGITAPVIGANGVAVVSLTNNSGGTVSNTIAAIGATYDQAEVRNAIASLAAKLNEVLAAQAS